MLLRLTHYATALTFLSALAVLYQNLITPWMQPPPVEAIAMGTSPVVRPDESLKDLFPDGCWQRGLCKQLQTSNGMLLFQHWQQTDDDQWKLWPVTVVIGRGMSGVKNEEPVILEAAGGAEIKFTESLDVMSGGAPPIRRGRLIGSVHVYRKDTRDHLRSLDLRTSNVGIDNRKIWTTETIEMNVGQARVVGRDLTIHFAGQASPDMDASPAILDRMELIYLEQMVMPLDSGGPRRGKRSPADPLTATQQSPATAAMISIQCGGRVEYDFAIDQLQLHDSISLIHQVPGMPADRFDCQMLRLTLNDPINDEIVRDSPIDWLANVLALGTPAVASLPSFDADVEAERIELDAELGLVRAEGRRGIRVRRGGIDARLAKLVYQFDPGNPKAIGTIDAPGPGIVHVDRPSVPLRKAVWRQGFRLDPVGVTTFDQINTNIELWIDGQFHAWLTDGGEFQADSIAGVLTPQPSDADGPATLAPDQFEISGSVRIDTSAIAAETELLSLFFVAEPDPKPTGKGDAAEPPQQTLRQWVIQPRGDRDVIDPVARPRPTIRGDTIVAQLRRNEDGLSAKDLTVTGSVEIDHHLQTGDQTLPLRMTGQQLRLMDAGGQDVLQIGSGTQAPARFELGDGFFVGPLIQIRPSDNIVWINSAGEFQMPTAALPTALSGQGDGEVVWTQPPHCRWQGEMIFDGRTAVLSDGVDVTASLINGREPWELRMSGDRLQVDLSEDVQVRDLRAVREATVQRISLLQANQRPVMVQALHRAPDGVLETKHLMHAMQLSMTPAGGGRIVGTGPGWYRGWTIAKDDTTAKSAAPKTAPPVDSSARKLRGIHLVFNDSMQADLPGQHLDFLRGVRVGVQPVADWDDAFDARNMDAISIGQSTLDCDRLRFNIEPGYNTARSVAGTRTPWEMEATSGVVFRTRSQRGLLEGTASRAAYSSSKDLFTVDGAPNRAAIFKHTHPDGSQGYEGAVSTMSIRPGTMEIEEIRLERLNIATPPGAVTR